MKKGLIKVLSFSIVLCILCLSGFSMEKNVDNLNKLHFYIDYEEYSSLKCYDELYELVDNMKMRDDEQFIFTVKFKSSYSQTLGYQQLIEEIENINSIEDAHLFRKKSNELSKYYHSNLISENLHLLNYVDYDRIDIIEYSPYVCVYVERDSLDVNGILNLIKNEAIEVLSISTEWKIESDYSFDSVLNYIDGYDIVSNSEYTGDGINIGIYEWGGCFDTQNPNFTNLNYSIWHSSNSGTDHGTKVTSIVAKIAPDANYYLSQSFNPLDLSWFVDNMCDVLNCSFGDKISPYCYRYDFDAVYDYISKFSFLTIVVSSGNYSETYNGFHITSPGYMYNGIVVGGTRLDEGEIVYDDTSSYISDGTVIKPDVASFISVSLPNTYSGVGTSFAAPQVTGSVALLMEKDYTYICQPEKVKAAITASSNKTYGYYNSEYGFDEHVGAGVLSMSRLLYIDYSYSMVNSNKTANYDVASYVVYLHHGDVIQIGLSWLIETTPVLPNNSVYPTSVSGIYVTDYDLLLYDSSMQLLSPLPPSYGNDEIVRYTANTSGYFTIVIRQNSAQSYSYYGDFISCAIKIE